MSLKCRCICGCKLLVATDSAGKRIKCPKCERKLRIPVNVLQKHLAQLEARRGKPQPQPEHSKIEKPLSSLVDIPEPEPPPLKLEANPPGGPTSEPAEPPKPTKPLASAPAIPSPKAPAQKAPSPKVPLQKISPQKVPPQKAPSPEVQSPEIPPPKAPPREASAPAESPSGASLEKVETPRQPPPLPKQVADPPKAPTEPAQRTEPPQPAAEPVEPAQRTEPPKPADEPVAPSPLPVGDSPEPESESTTKADTAVEPPRLETEDVELPVRSYEADRHKVAIVRWLAAAILLTGLVGTVPAIIDVVEHVLSESSEGLSRWACGLLLIGLLQCAYAVYLVQLPDWSSVWVVTIFTLVIASGYAAMFGLTLLSTDQGNFIQLLELADRLRGGKATAWCLLMLCLTSVTSYFSGRLGASWRHAFVG